MAGLLSIPQELRDQILELALSTIDSPPQNPSAAVDYVELHDTELQSWCDGNHVRYLNKPVTPDALSILLVNRSLHTDMLAVLTRIRPPFELDVILEQLQPVPQHTFLFEDGVSKKLCRTYPSSETSIFCIFIRPLTYRLSPLPFLCDLSWLKG
jgi:hypothetical protein